jgi:hypothetical protein
MVIPNTHYGRICQANELFILLLFFCHTEPLPDIGKRAEIVFYDPWSENDLGSAVGIGRIS